MTITVRSYPQDLAIEDFMEAGRDLRLDRAYPEFYKAQHLHGGNAALPTPLDTTTLFNSLAKRLLEGQDGRTVDTGHMAPAASGPGVQQLINLVQGVDLTAVSLLLACLQVWSTVTHVCIVATVMHHSAVLSVRCPTR